jgi:hypothetical protein
MKKNLIVSTIMNFLKNLKAKEAIKKQKRKKKVSPFICDPSSDEALEKLRQNLFLPRNLRKIKAFPSKVSKFQRSFRVLIRKNWFSSRRKIINIKIYWLKKNKKILKKEYEWKEKFLSFLQKKTFEQFNKEKNYFQKKYDDLANNIMETEADYLKLINLEKNT